MYHFDYSSGDSSIYHNQPFPKMPEKIVQKGSMSLWNLALEFHTARYYSFMFGDLYILFVTVNGLTMITILITGFWAWWKFYNRKKSRNSVENIQSF